MSEADGVWRGVVDFEHVRWDVRAADFSHWWDLYTADRPDLAQAFFEGYGQAPDGRLGRQLLVVRTLNALSRIAWAVAHHDIDFEAQARAALQRVAALVARQGWSGVG
jgi:hypothetical protein